MYITIEEARKYFENNDNPSKVINSIWKRHWNNVINTNDVIVLNNLLKNHLRLLSEKPERNNRKERENIINFIKEKIKNINV